MLQHEAEEAAARRNREDPRRDSFVFYALDESAGIAPDAWEVAMRLRRDDERPRRRSREPQRTTPAPAPHAPATAVMEPELVATPPTPAEWDDFPATEVYDVAVEPPAPLAPDPPRRRFGLVGLWGVFVVLVGLAFIAGVLIVAFTFRDYTHLGTSTWGTGVAAGLVAVLVGVALIRRR